MDAESFLRPTGVRNLMTASIRSRAMLLLSLAMLVGLWFAALPASGQVAGLPAQVVDYDPPQRLENYRVTNLKGTASPRDDSKGKARFRVIERTGNCCENYLTADSKGTLYDLGGSYVNFTSDSGKSWKSVRPIQPLVNGEGTLVVAPNGDIVGVEWDVYSGDHFMAYKYTAATKTWEYLEAPLHTPFYDRPWLSVIPGPITVNGAKVPYVVFVDGYPHSGTLLYSTDGLTYLQTSDPSLDQQVGGETVPKLQTKGDRSLDWVQPNSQSPIVPLGGGSALAPPGLFSEAWSVLDPKTLRWHAVELDAGELAGRYQVDSKGRLHNVRNAPTGVEYRISTDGGRTWKSTILTLPKDTFVPTGMMLDFRANRRLGLAAVAMHVRSGETDGDLVFKVDISSDKPKALQMYEIGLADIDAAAGVGQQIRFDFETVAILPSGKIAVSFLDSTTGPIYHLAELALDRLGPAVAVEL